MNIIADIRKAISPPYPRHEAEAIARIVVEDVFGVTLLDCLSNNVILSPTQQRQMEDIIARLQQGEPIQYIIGETTFCGHQFQVTPAVLIPRPETEDMISLILNDITDPSCELSVCDAGTGSGCIAISLQKALPQSHVSALDISREALEVAQGNAVRNQAAIHFTQADILDIGTLPQGLWDLIVSNPPYVTNCEKAEMAVHVKCHEPSKALFVPDDNALVFYTALARWAHKTLSPQGTIYCELNSILAAETEQVFRHEGFTHTSLHLDRYNNYRFIRCKR